MSGTLMSDIVGKLISYGIATPKTIKGCSIEEVHFLENYFNINLPNVYKEFLLTMGHIAGSFYQGTDMFFRHLIDIQKWARDLLEENGQPFQLSNETFVFSMHQGYQFTYFYTLDSNDPPVYYYIEGSSYPEKKWISFSDFLITSVNDHIKILN
jgi:hypothetical protein